VLFRSFLWYDAAGALGRFQLCYDRYGDEHAVTWDWETNRLVHQAVQGGQGFYSHGTSGMLETPRKPPPDLLIQRFREVSESLPANARECILRVMAMDFAA
jgi:hypothetical protein